jgi:hypothetical protein
VIAAVGQDARPGRTHRPRPSLLVARILRLEIKHSAFVWAIPLMALLFIYDPFRTASGYPELWTVRASVVENKFWPDCVPFAAAFSAWAGSREGRRHVSDLLATTARPAWTRQLCSLAGTLAWVLAAFLAGAAVLYVATATSATWGGPPLWPVVVGVVALTAVCALAFTLGALFPGRFTAPIVAVGMLIITLVAFRNAVNASGGPVGVLSPDGAVPPSDAGIFYPVAPDVSIVRVMFFAGAALGAIGLLGLSPRTGGAGWRAALGAGRRGALGAGSGGGARLRTLATAVFAVGVALAVTGFGLAGTATNGDTEIPALHDSASGQPIPYTPVCGGSASFPVCLHPAYKNYLSQAVASFGLVMAELAGLPGAPGRATEVSDQALPAVVFQGNDNGVVAGTPPVYEFTMDALGSGPDAAQLQAGVQQDIVHAVIVGPIGQLATTNGSQGFQPDTGTPAQQAVVNGLLKAIGAQPYLTGTVNGPGARQFQQQQAQIAAAAGRFAARPAATRHAWLAANLATLKAGHITLAQIP